jgi:hypothetical protein
LVVLEVELGDDDDVVLFAGAAAGALARGALAAGAE